jgi:hypothetical protein
VEYDKSHIQTLFPDLKWFLLEEGRCKMGYKFEEKNEEAATENQCRHHWIIDSAEGPLSKGVCKHCGAENYFHNSFSGPSNEGRKANRLELAEIPNDEPDGDESKLEKSGAVV